MNGNEHDNLVGQFEAQRARLHAVAYRMLGSTAAADDAVQETWLRFCRADANDVVTPGSWLTAVIARVCLDQLRARTARREQPFEVVAEQWPEPGVGTIDPEREAQLADAVGLAMLTMLDTLAPAERIAFVLHDMFALSFDEIAPVVGRNATATRKLASRARQRLQGANRATGDDAGRRREVVHAFLAASRGGDFAALLTLLDPEVVLRADPAAVRMGALTEVRGAAAVAETFKGRAQVAQTALLGGVVGAAWFAADKPRVAFAFTIAGGRITAIELLADADRLQALHIITIP